MQRGATGKSTSAISTQDAEATVFERRMRRPYLMKLRHRSPWVHCCTCTCKCIIDDHCVIFSVSLIYIDIMDQFIILHALLTHHSASRAGFMSRLSRLLGRWVGFAGCQVNQVTEKTENLFGASNELQRPSCSKIGKHLWQILAGLHQCFADAIRPGSSQ